MLPLIMVVEDQADVALMLRYNLEAGGYQVSLAGDGDEASQMMRDTVPDLVMLDWMLPGVSGIELCRRWRARAKTARVPIIMLSARGVEEERIRGLETGADDYIVKPFSVPDLMARVKAVLRRANAALVADRLMAGDVELDHTTRRVRRAGREVRLGPTEYRLLEHFMRSPGRVFSRSQLLDKIWGTDIYLEERTVDVHVGRLRKNLNRGKKKDPIRTVRGTGYAFDDRFCDG